MNDVNNVADFESSVAVTIDVLKKLREEGHQQPAQLAALNERLMDLTLFAANKRQNALKKVNQALGTTWSMTQVRKAKVEKPVTKPAEKAIHTDALEGVAAVPAKINPEEPAAEAGAPAVISGGEVAAVTETPKTFTQQEITAMVLRAGSIAGSIVHFMANTANIGMGDHEGRGALYSSFLATLGDAALDDYSNFIALFSEEGNNDTFFPATDLAFSFMITDAFAGNSEAFEAYVTKHVKQSQSSNTRQELTQENDTMTNLNQQASLADQVLAASPLRQGNNAPAAATNETGEYKKASQQFLDLLSSAGVTTMDQFKTIAFNFVRANMDLTPKLLAVAEQHPGLDEMASFEQLCNSNPDIAKKFTAFIFVPANHLKSETAVATQPDTFGSKVMRTMRGNRETGFSSGVVAAAAAVVGGGAEMFFRGGPSIGSGVGTAVGAVGGYFAAEAAEKLMNSETGRYILAGSIGLVAGGVGSSLGRTVESRGISGLIPGSEATDAPVEVARPLPTPAAADGFVPMFGA
ncbi:hypothetical protein D3C81_376390 [compost metagenome]